MSWILIVVLYTGGVTETSYDTKEQCELALFTATDGGKHKHISVAECYIEE